MEKTIERKNEMSLTPLVALVGVLDSTKQASSANEHFWTGAA